jgi:hypothetical protein
MFNIPVQKRGISASGAVFDTCVSPIAGGRNQAEWMAQTWIKAQYLD